MATENKEQVFVAMEGDIGNAEKLIKLAKECGFKTLFAAMPRDLKRAEAKLAEILALASVDGEMRERLAADYGPPSSEASTRTSWVRSRIVSSTS